MTPERIKELRGLEIDSSLTPAEKDTRIKLRSIALPECLDAIESLTIRLAQTEARESHHHSASLGWTERAKEAEAQVSLLTAERDAMRRALEAALGACHDNRHSLERLPTNPPTNAALAAVTRVLEAALGEGPPRICTICGDPITPDWPETWCRGCDDDSLLDEQP